MAYRKAEVRRESETKIILITTARATQHIKRRTAKDIVPRGDDFAVCARARSDASSAGVGEGGGGLAAVGGWRRGSLQWAFVGRLAQIQTQRRQFVLRTYAREHYTGVVGIGCSSHLVQDYTNVGVRGDRGVREVECTNSRVQSTTQSESKFGRKNPPLE
ncbi:hypothetical protein QTP88_014534 [Uroleucon formosanum]